MDEASQPARAAHAALDAIRSESIRMGELTKRIMSFGQYRTRDYLTQAHRIVDINKASEETL